MILPHLTELHLLPDGRETFDDDANLSEIIQTFLLQRDITHLTDTCAVAGKHRLSKYNNRPRTETFVASAVEWLLEWEFIRVT
jgi:hypothetical protein